MFIPSSNSFLSGVACLYLLASASVEAQITDPYDGLRYVPSVAAQFSMLTERPEAMGLHISDAPDGTECLHYQGMERVNASDGTPYFYITKSGNLPGAYGGLVGIYCDLGTIGSFNPNGHLIIAGMGSRDKHSSAWAAARSSSSAIATCSAQCSRWPKSTRTWWRCVPLSRCRPTMPACA